MESQILTIKKVRFVDKWVEFWFEEPIDDPNSSFDLCSKSYKLWDAIDRFGIYDDVISNGLIGRKIKWVKKGYNWEIEGFFDTEEHDKLLKVVTNAIKEIGDVSDVHLGRCLYDHDVVGLEVVELLMEIEKQTGKIIDDSKMTKEDLQKMPVNDFINWIQCNIHQMSKV